MPGRILVVDDVATNRILMKVRLAESFYDVIQADCGAKALEMAETAQPDLILLDVVMADINGIDVCRKLKTNPRTCDIPVIMITAAREPLQKLRALQAGAEDYLQKPLDEVTLLARVRSLLRARETEKAISLREGTRTALGFAEAPTEFEHPPLVAFVAGQADKATLWKAQLAPHLNGRQIVMTRAQALSQNRNEAEPDLYVVAADLQQTGDGLRLLSDLRSRPSKANAAIIMVMRADAGSAAAMALDLGANDIVTSPFQTDEIVLRINTQLFRKRRGDRLREMVENGLQLAVTDPLTGLYNRRYALSHLGKLASGGAHGTFSVMHLDLDRFKAINDQHGHATGDAVLEKLARLLEDELRSSDMVARTGGEEFLVVMPRTNPKSAKAIAERLRKTISSTPFPHPGRAKPLHISASIGLTSWAGPDDTPTDVMARADKALYAAKAAGRNVVTVSEDAA